jgi:hypothetical protein
MRVTRRPFRPGLWSPEGLRRREFLLAATALSCAPERALPQHPGPAAQWATGAGKPLIVVFAEGGWDVTHVFDPKLGVPTIDGPDADPNAPGTESVRTFGNIPLLVNDYVGPDAIARPEVTKFFEAWHQKVHVVNGVWTGSIAHDPCRYRMLTGDPSGRKPDLASISGATFGETLPLGAVDLSGWSIAGSLAASSGRVGDQNQIVALIDDALELDQEFNEPPSFTGALSYPLSTLSPTDQNLIQDFVAHRAERLRSRFGGDRGHNDERLDDLLQSLDRGRAFRDQADDILGGDSALQLGRKSNFFSQIDIAVELIEKGLCHSVTIDSRSDWDSHESNINQHAYFNSLFAGLQHLMEVLSDKGLLDQVVVPVLSEMTRTPQLNGANGKDHWAHTSALLMGAVRGNAVSGGTTELLESRPINLETGALDDAGELNKYDNFTAGILELAGVDPSGWLPNVVPFRGAHPV